jgi:1,4-alpha-glucan branching enzyme
VRTIPSLLASKSSGGPFRLAPARLLFPMIKPQTNTKMKMKTQLFQDKNLGPINRMAQFTFPAATARQVSLAGDFNNWDTKASPMHKGPDGVWHLGVALKPGRYEYRFFADEVWCNDSAAQQKTMNPLGTENCVRIV